MWGRGEGPTGNDPEDLWKFLNIGFIARLYVKAYLNTKNSDI